MRHRVALARLFLVLLGAITLHVAVPAAHAAPPLAAVGDVKCQKIDIYTGRCLIDVLSPSGPGSPSVPVSGHSNASTNVASCYSGWSHSVVPCSSSAGSWSNGRDCYVRQSSEVAGSLLFEGHTDGAVYSCIPDIGDQFQTAYSFWAAAPPAGPDPAQLAQEAIAAMGLTAVAIGIVPDDDEASVGLVGLPVWMWVDQPTATTFGPASATAAAGGVSVTANAHVEDVTWAMGDGDTVTCAGPGTAYSDADGASSSPDCGHTYTRASVGHPGNAYTVTATSHWLIDWAGGGAAGQQTMDLTATTMVRVGETQAVITVGA